MEIVEYGMFFFAQAMQSLVSALLWDAEVSFYRRFRVIDSVWHRPAVQTKLATACGCDFGCVCINTYIVYIYIYFFFTVYLYCLHMEREGGERERDRERENITGKQVH